MRRGLVRGTLVAVAMGLLGAGWFSLQADPIFSHSRRDVIVHVHPGDSFSTISSELAKAGVISSSFAFRLEGLFFGAPLVQSGAYELAQGSSFSTVRAILSHGPNVAVLQVLPGLTIHELALSLAGQKGNAYAVRFLHLATTTSVPTPFAGGSSLEGLVGTGSYVIQTGERPLQLLKDMVSRFNRQAHSVGLSATTSRQGLNAYQLITAASIVQKEGYYPKNMPRVARVIYNRLANGSALQMDATILYALGRDGGTVTPAMLQTPSAYNTYLNAGLTPTPICAVSSDALRAVLHAPPGPWLYFVVVDKSGDEAFASTFAQQLRNEALARQRGLS